MYDFQAVCLEMLRTALNLERLTLRMTKFNSLYMIQHSHTYMTYDRFGEAFRVIFV